MPFKRPTPQEISKRLQVEIDQLATSGDARLRNTVEGVLARVVAMASHELFGFIDWISKQILPITADDENLDRHSTIWKVPRKVATKAMGTVKFTGSNSVVVPSGTILRRSDDVEYSVILDTPISAGIANCKVTAVSAGVIGNSPVGTKVTLTSPIPGIVSDAVVLDDGSGNGLTGGTEIEENEDLRDRILSRIQAPPHGGAKADYEQWALEVPGVTRAWPYPQQSGRGTVDLTFVMDNKPGTVIPSANEVQAVQDYLEIKRPMTADVTVFAPTPVPVNFEIQLSPYSLAVQNAIKDELKAFFRREAKPGGTLLISRIREAISTAAGEYDHNLVSPSANIPMDYGQMPIVGSFTWSAI